MRVVSGLKTWVQLPPPPCFPYLGDALGDVLKGAGKSEFLYNMREDTLGRLSCIKCVIEAWADGFMLRHVRGSTS